MSKRLDNLKEELEEMKISQFFLLKKIDKIEQLIILELQSLLETREKNANTSK